MVVKDRLSKQAHFIPVNKAIDAEKTVELYMDNVFKHHGIPSAGIYSDRGPQFVSQFWKEFLRLLGSKSKLTTAYHPAANGGAEVTNQIVAQYLRHAVGYLQDDWVMFLGLLEFTYTNTKNSQTGYSPFYLIYRNHPTFDPLLVQHSTVPKAEERIKLVKEVKEEAKLRLKYSQECFKKFADEKRKEHNFKVGDKVMLSAKNIRTLRPCVKLESKFFGPFLIIGKINSVTYKLELPKKMNIHNVFHVSLFKKFTGQAKVQQDVEVSPMSIKWSNSEEHTVSTWVDSK
eukprot:Pgem_evm1s1153